MTSYPNFTELLTYKYNSALTVLDFRTFTFFGSGTAQNEKVKVSEIFLLICNEKVDCNNNFNILAPSVSKNEFF